MTYSTPIVYVREMGERLIHEDCGETVEATDRFERWYCETCEVDVNYPESVVTEQLTRAVVVLVRDGIGQEPNGPPSGSPWLLVRDLDAADEEAGTPWIDSLYHLPGLA